MEWLRAHAELVGIMSTAMVIISFTLVGERRIRMTNIIGAALFVVYGLLIDAFSVWFLNSVLIGVHVYRLYIIHKQSNYLRRHLTTLYTHDNTKIQNFREGNR